MNFKIYVHFFQFYVAASRNLVSLTLNSSQTYQFIIFIITTLVKAALPLLSGGGTKWQNVSKQKVCKFTETKYTQAEPAQTTPRTFRLGGGHG